MADFTSQAQPFSITPLEGPLKLQQIKLEGRALPYKGVAFETEQRVKTTYYPGNPVATQQYMGPVDKNTMIHGIWKDRFLGNGQSQQLLKLFEGLVRTATPVEIKWGDLILSDGEILERTQPIVRQGVIKRIKHTYDIPQDIQWEMEFEFYGRGETSAPPLTVAGIMNPRDNFSVVHASFEDSYRDATIYRTSPIIKISGIFPDTSNINPLQVPVPLTTALAVVNATVDQVQTVMDAAQTTWANGMQFLDSVNNTASTTSILSKGVQERARAIMEGGKNAALVALETLTRLPPSLSIIQDTALFFLEERNMTMGLLEKFTQTAVVSSTTEKQISARLTTAVIAEVRPPAGTDLRDLALQYYGDTEMWYLIANYNGLVSSVVPANPDGPSDSQGYPIFIPQRDAGETSDISQQCPC